MRSIHSFAFALTGALVAFGCATGSPPDAGFDTQEPITVAVENRNALDVNVEVLANGVERNLGTVSTGEQRVFVVPNADRLLDLRLNADPIGSPTEYWTDDITVSPGAQVSLTVGTVISQSYWSVY